MTMENDAVGIIHPLGGSTKMKLRPRGIEEGDVLSVSDAFFRRANQMSKIFVHGQAPLLLETRQGDALDE